MTFPPSLSGTLAIIACSLSGTALAAGPVINEFVFNHTGTDDAEYVEILGEPLTDYGELTLLQPDSDNRGDQNPERVQIQLDGTLYPFEVPAVVVGDKLDDILGVVGYSFGNFEVNALQRFGIEPGELARETTRLTGNRQQVTVAGYNVLNLSPDTSDDKQRAALAAQIVHYLQAPDVIALQEIQDNSGEIDDGTVAADQTLQALANAIAAAGGPDYAFFDVAPEDGSGGGVPGGNIRNAFLYNPQRCSITYSSASCCCRSPATTSCM